MNGHQHVWGPIRVTHLGPRSTRPHIEAGHLTAIDQTEAGAVHTGVSVPARRDLPAGPTSYGFSVIG
jgi:hypothetical protein